jgi:hypothetical protein
VCVWVRVGVHARVRECLCVCILLLFFFLFLLCVCVFFFSHSSVFEPSQGQVFSCLYDAPNLFGLGDTHPRIKKNDTKNHQAHILKIL